MWGRGALTSPPLATFWSCWKYWNNATPDFQGLLLNDDHTDKGRDAIVLVRGRHIEHLDGVRTPLSEQDYVAVTPLVAGG